MIKKCAACTGTCLGRDCRGSGKIAFQGIRIAALITMLLGITASTSLAGHNRVLSVENDGGVSITTGPSTELDLPAANGFAFRFRLSSAPVANTHFGILHKTGSQTQYHVTFTGLSGSMGVFRVDFGNAVRHYSTSRTWQPNVWYHAVFTHSGGSTGRWYFNGELNTVTTAASCIRSGAGILEIGRAPGVSDWNGALDDISIWNRMLSAADVTNLVTGQLTGSETGLVGFWNFDDGTPSDLTPYANHGVLLPKTFIKLKDRCMIETITPEVGSHVRLVFETSDAYQYYQIESSSSLTPVTWVALCDWVSVSSNRYSFLDHAPLTAKRFYRVRSTVDPFPPANVSNFSATPGDTQVMLEWLNPSDMDFAGVIILRRTGSYPTSTTDGTVVYNGTGTATTDTGLINGTVYFYKAFSYDGVPNYASGKVAAAMPFP